MPVNWPEKWTVKALKHCPSCGSAPPWLGSLFDEGVRRRRRWGWWRSRRRRRTAQGPVSRGARGRKVQHRRPLRRAAHGQGATAAAAQRGYGLAAARSGPARRSPSAGTQTRTFRGPSGFADARRLTRLSPNLAQMLSGPWIPGSWGCWKAPRRGPERVRRRRLRGTRGRRLLPQEEVQDRGEEARRGPGPGLPSGLWVGGWSE